MGKVLVISQQGNVRKTTPNVVKCHFMHLLIINLHTNLSGTNNNVKNLEKESFRKVKPGFISSYLPYTFKKKNYPFILS